ncbi:MAG: ATP-binding cassette domain-containing protein [Chloroflexota bacterium]
MSAYIEIKGLKKTFHTPAGEFAALRGIDICFELGEMVAVIGKSGSGKSTFINCLSGIDFPTSGSIRVGDTHLQDLNEKQMARWRGRSMGIVFQFFQLMPTLTVLENIMLPLEITGSRPKKEWRTHAGRLLEKVGLETQALKLPGALSGGQQQRVAIARALANDPPLLIADEPTGNLDSSMAEEVFRLFRSLVDEGKTVLMVTHDDDFARRVDRTVIISDGLVVDEFLVKALHQLSRDAIMEIAAEVEPAALPPGAQVFRQGQPGDCFYVVLDGVCEVLYQRPGGSEIVIAERKPGDYFGEAALILGAPRNATVRAGERPVRLLPISHTLFDRLVQTMPTFRQEMEQVAQARSRHLCGQDQP